MPLQCLFRVAFRAQRGAGAHHPELISRRWPQGALRCRSERARTKSLLYIRCARTRQALEGERKIATPSRSSHDKAIVRANDRERIQGLLHDDPVGGLDRKSTRLNSSHVKISYAVFCLKKKKQKFNRNVIKKKYK